MRNSILAPLSIDLRRKIALSALTFFSPTTQEETFQVLDRPYPGGTIVPLDGFDFLTYLERKGELPEAMRYLHVVRQLLESMVRAGWLMHMAPSGNAIMPMTYYYLKENTNIEKKSFFTLANVLGLDFLYSLMAPNLVHILGKNKHGDEHGGTGMLIAPNVILSCAHVLRDLTLFPTQEVGGQKVGVRSPKCHTNIDIGLLYLDHPVHFSTAGLPFIEPQVGMDIAIFGYPKIPQVRQAPITLQKGEVTCSNIARYDGSIIFLFSAIARPGNSGGPILSADGRFLGIVTEDLIYEGIESPEKYFQPHFAGTPTSEVAKAVHDLDPSISLPIEDYQ